MKNAILTLIGLMGLLSAKAQQSVIVAPGITAIDPTIQLEAARYILLFESTEDDIDDIVSAHRAETYKAPEHLKHQWHAAIDEAAALERGRAAEPRQGNRLGLGFLGFAVTAALAIGRTIEVRQGERCVFCVELAD